MSQSRGASNTIRRRQGHISYGHGPAENVIAAPIEDKPLYYQAMMSGNTLSGRTILITGGARRLGAVMAQALHKAGANIILHCRRSVAEAHELAESLQTERRDSVTVITADLSELQSIFSAMNAALQSFRQLDALINNASFFEPGSLEPADIEQWEQLHAVNVRAPWLLAAAAAPHLRRTRGCIVNILDIYAERPLPNYPVYSTTQGALATLTRALALELAPDVRVNAIAPGAILWPEGEDDRDRQAIIDSTALNRMGIPQDIAQAALFLIRDATYTTGEVLTVDGGRRLGLGVWQ